MQVRVISLDAGREVGDLVTLFPEWDVSVQSGVDLRKVDSKHLFSEGLIAPSAYTTLEEGRRWHYEFNSKGGVGLIQANRLALERGDSPLLLLEDDYNVVDASKLRREVDLLLREEARFDMAVFGASYSPPNKTGVDFMPAGWVWVESGKFWFLHCVLFTSEGRRKVSRLLSDERADMQLDSLYSTWAELGELRIVAQTSSPSVVQKRRGISNIQSDFCILCRLPTKDSKLLFLFLVFTSLVVTATLLLSRRSRR